MSRLHEALKSLSPVDFADVPLDDLETYLRDAFSNAELIANSVPPPPGGTDFHSAKPAHRTPNAARSASEVKASEARAPSTDPSYEELQSSWGKPLKLSAKDNPLGISVYKMAGHDRHGAWFARRSVHEGLGFDKFRKAMKREFPESLTVQGGPGEGNIRGIGGDRRLEQKVIDGVGKLEVYQLSAQFPGPTAPREFITLLCTSDTGLSERSAPNLNNTPTKIPRHFLVVSRPTQHPVAPPRDGMVRGQYESVELIREIPINPKKSSSTTDLPATERSSTEGRHRGKTIGIADDGRADKHDGNAMDPELNPVEWIMITRSDPGGGIPRFMVERGTPSSIVADAGKFLDWACSKDDFPSMEESEEQIKETPPGTSATTEATAQQPPPPAVHEDSLPNGTSRQAPTSQPSQSAAPEQQEGYIATAEHALQSAIANYAPAIVQNNLPFFSPEDAEKATQPPRDLSDDDSTDTSSLSSFASAQQYNTAEEGFHANAPVAPSTDSLSIRSSPSPTTSLGLRSSDKLVSQHEKEMNKIEEKRRQLQEKHATARSKEEQKLKDMSMKEQKEVEKVQQRHERELQKQQEKHDKQMKKLEQKKEKEARKLEEKKRKAAEKDTMTRLQRDRDEYKSQLEMCQKENELLKAQVGELQRENTALVSKLGKTEQGQVALRSIRDELDLKRNRSFSLRSQSSSASHKSGDSLGTLR